MKNQILMIGNLHIMPISQHLPPLISLCFFADLFFCDTKSAFGSVAKLLHLRPDRTPALLRFLKKSAEHMAYIPGNWATDAAGFIESSTHLHLLLYSKVYLRRFYFSTVYLPSSQVSLLLYRLPHKDALPYPRKNKNNVNNHGKRPYSIVDAHKGLKKWSRIKFTIHFTWNHQIIHRICLPDLNRAMQRILK